MSYTPAFWLAFITLSESTFCSLEIFSSTFPGNSTVSWGKYPTYLPSSSSDHWDISAPSSITFPASAGQIPSNTLHKDVFPAADGPIIPRVSPGSREKDILCKILRPFIANTIFSASSFPSGSGKDKVFFCFLVSTKCLRRLYAATASIEIFIEARLC